MATRLQPSPWRSSWQRPPRDSPVTSLALTSPSPTDGDAWACRTRSRRSMVSSPRRRLKGTSRWQRATPGTSPERGLVAPIRSTDPDTYLGPVSGGDRRSAEFPAGVGRCVFLNVGVDSDPPPKKPAAFRLPLGGGVIGGALHAPKGDRAFESLPLWGESARQGRSPPDRRRGLPRQPAPTSARVSARGRARRPPPKARPKLRAGPRREGILPSLARVSVLALSQALGRRASRRGGKAECPPSEGPSL